MIDWTQMKTAETLAAEAKAATLAQITAAIDAHVEAQAKALGYNDAAACAGYTTSSVTAWAAEAQRFVAWRDDVWTSAYAMQYDHEAAGTVPTVEDVIDALPEWGA